MNTRKYEIIIPKPVCKELDNLSDEIYGKIIEKIEKLKENPRPFGCVKLRRYKNEYRIRIGDYRVRYEINDRERRVILLHCMHRKDIYRKR